MNTVDTKEQVARLLNNNWFDEGELLQVAFMLKVHESYIYVNRPAIKSYEDDVRTFVDGHVGYLYSTDCYRRALLNVGDINSIDVAVGGSSMSTSVEVEPRDSHIKSHAGIFTRFQGMNLKSGEWIDVEALDEEVSADTILLEVRSRLLTLCKVEECSLNSDY